MGAIPRILSKVYCEPWAIEPSAHYEIQRVLTAHLAGELPAPEEAAAITEQAGQFQNAKRQAFMERKAYPVVGGTAVIPVFGTIGKHLSFIETVCGGVDVDRVMDLVDEAESDGRAKQILLYFNSPGGVVTGIPEAANKTAAINARKRVIAYTDSQMCSAAYWWGAQADAIYTSESAVLGSIGVYTYILDRTAQLEKEGIKVNAMSAGKYKLAGAPWQPLSDEDRARFQAGVDETYEQFTRAVNARRPGVKSETMQGQTFKGSKAVAARLADGIFDSVDDILAYLAR